MKKFLSICAIAAITLVSISAPAEAGGGHASRHGGHRGRPQVVHHVRHRPVIVRHHNSYCNRHCNHGGNVVVYHSYDNQAARIAALTFGTIGVAALVSTIVR